MIQTIGIIFLKFLSFIISFFSVFLKKKNINELIFCQDKSGVTPNIRLEKIVKSLNKKQIYPNLFIHKSKLINFTKIEKCFKKIYTYNNFIDLLIFSIKNNKSKFSFFTESELLSGLTIRLCNQNKFYFDNYDQIVGIHKKNILFTIIEKFLILNSYNICRSNEIKILKEKNIKHIFFPDYISKILLTEQSIIKKRTKEILDVCYGGKVKESREWGKNTYDHNLEEVIVKFSKFKKINLHIFPSSFLSEKSRNDYINLCNKYNNVFFYETLKHDEYLKKIVNFDFGLTIFPSINEIANKKNKYSMANKLFDYLSCGMIILYPNFDLKTKINPFSNRFLKHYNFLASVNIDKNEDYVASKLFESLNKMNFKNLEKNLIDNQIHRLIKFYGIGNFK